MPTPPPLWMETHEAPLAVFNSALSRGQSATASLPSFMPSVSRKGEATEPVSRWSRPITIAQPADARRQPLELDALARQLDPAAQDAVLGKQLQHQFVRGMDVGS